MTRKYISSKICRYYGGCKTYYQIYAFDSGIILRDIIVDDNHLIYYLDIIHVMGEKSYFDSFRSYLENEIKDKSFKLVKGRKHRLRVKQIL